MAETKQKEIPMKCAFDKARVCNATCVAFFVIQSAGGTQFGCKRLR